MANSVESQLNSYIHLLNAAQQKSLLGYVKTTFPGKEEEAISLEQENKELEEIDAAMDSGEFYTHEEATELIKELINAGK